MRKSWGEGNSGEDLLGAFIIFKNRLIISAMSASPYGEALGVGQARARDLQGVQPFREGEHMCPKTPFQLNSCCCLGRSLSYVGTLAGTVGSWGRSAHFVWGCEQGTP